MSVPGSGLDSHFGRYDGTWNALFSLVRHDDTGIEFSYLNFITQRPPSPNRKCRAHFVATASPMPMSTGDLRCRVARCGAGPYGREGAVRPNRILDFLAFVFWLPLDLRLVVQYRIQQRVMDFDLTIVTDKSEFAEFIHEETHAGSCRADHFG